MSRLKVSVVVDNPSWILPYAERLVTEAAGNGHSTSLVRSYRALGEGDVAFMLGCTGIADAAILRRNRFNMVAHESDLPGGRGFAPVAWQVLEGKRSIPVVLFEASASVDGGPIYLRDTIELSGYELNDEIRRLQGETTVSLCMAFLRQYPNFEPSAQSGAASWYARRAPKDSALDPDKSIRAQFNLLRTVDNERYPAFFEIDGHRYILKIFRAQDH